MHITANIFDRRRATEHVIAIREDSA
jgi:hypothetical protein